MAVTTPRLNLAEIGALQFEPLEAARFPALGLARAALNAGLLSFPDCSLG
jgi:1-deoxy-D-xylulose 5-phosphate reductoisomerase